MPNRRPGHTAPAKLALTNPQRRLESCERIVAAATTLAALGDVGCQMRSVAAAAGMAPSTVYRYFSSKDDLLLACLHRWLRDFCATSADADDSGLGSSQRVLDIATKLTVSLCSSPRFTEAVIRPYLYAHAETSGLADIVHQQLIEIFCTAMHCGQPTQTNRNIAEVLTGIWVTNVVAISQQRSSLDNLLHRLSLVVSCWQYENSSAESTTAVQQATVGNDEEHVA